MTVAALEPLAGAAAGAGEGAGTAVAARGGGQVIDGKVVSSKPLNGRNTRTRERAKDTATGAGLGQMISGTPFGKSAKGPDFGGPGNGRKILVAEFILCMVVLAFSPLTGKAPSAGAFMKRGSAIMGVFFVLALISTGGRGASRAAAGFGGLITLVLLISDRSIFVTLSKKYGAGVGEEPTDLGGLDAPPDDPGDDEDEGGATGAGEGVGNVIGIGEGIGDVLGGLIPLPPLGPLGNGIR